MESKKIIKQFLNDYYRHIESMGDLDAKFTIKDVLQLQYDILSDDLFYGN